MYVNTTYFKTDLFYIYIEATSRGAQSLHRTLSSGITPGYVWDVICDVGCRLELLVNKANTTLCTIALAFYFILLNNIFI